MKSIITLVGTSTPVTADHFAALTGDATINWLAPAKAGAVTVAERPTHAQIRTWRESLAADAIDIFVTEADNRLKKLLLCDMDSTIVAEETLDMLAEHAGCGDAIAAITERAMRGEIEFEQALRDRVAMLAEQPEALLAQAREDISFSPGAQLMTVALKMGGAHTCLVTGGFDFFAAYAAEACGFDEYHANHLEVAGGRLTGKVHEPILGRHGKQEVMLALCGKLQIRPADVLAVGDGANDLPMLQAAGLGIGYRPKPLVADSLDNCIIHGDLSAVLYATGQIPGARGA